VATNEKKGGRRGGGVKCPEPGWEISGRDRTADDEFNYLVKHES